MSRAVRRIEQVRLKSAVLKKELERSLKELG
jgi:hypothetical protein